MMCGLYLRSLFRADNLKSNFTGIMLTNSVVPQAWQFCSSISSEQLPFRLGGYPYALVNSTTSSHCSFSFVIYVRFSILRAILASYTGGFSIHPDAYSLAFANVFNLCLTQSIGVSNSLVTECCRLLSIRLLFRRQSKLLSLHPL